MIAQAMERIRYTFSSVSLISVTLVLFACGGGGGDKAPADPVVDTYSLGVNVTGLVGTGLSLVNIGGDALSVDANGNFTFASKVSDGSVYDVTVANKPATPSQTCSVSNGIGTVAGADITNITVDCVVDNFTIGGSVSGLASSGLVLQNNTFDDLVIDTDGNFSFATSLTDLSTYNVTVKNQPVSETCEVNNSNGSLAGANVTSIDVVCNATSVTVQTANRFIANSQSIVLLFDESMNTTSLAIGGSLSVEATPAWSTTVVANDTLTISPKSFWSVGIDRTLMVDVRNLSDQPISTQSLSYDILGNNTRFVSSSAIDDSGDGLTIGTAFRSVQAAIASISMTPAMILVNQGTYDASTTPVTLQDGISLYGGYNADFTDRKSKSFVSSIINTTNTDTMNTTGTISPSTVVDGFSISTEGKKAINVSSGANLVFQNNVVTGGNSNSGFRQGFFLDGSNPVIRNNTITGGNGSSGFSFAIEARNGSQAQIYNNLIIGGGYSTAYGIFIRSSDLNIHNNVIIGLVGSGTGSGTGIRGDGASSPVIRNNTISGGLVSFTTRIGVTFNDGITPTIDNNIIFHSGLPGAQCVRLSNVPNINSLRNNNLAECQILYFQTETTPSGCDGIIVPCTTTTLNELRTIDDVNNLPIASNNVSIATSFASEAGTDGDVTTPMDNDWHLSNSIPATVKAGGLNGNDDGGWGFNTDKDGVTRPATNIPWSIGAYQ